MPALYVTYGLRRAKINFTMFLTFFEYAVLMPSGAKLNYLCKDTNFMI